MDVRRLQTNQEIALLANYVDDFIKSEGVDHGQIVQFYQVVPPENRDSLFIAAALVGGQVVGYVSAIEVNAPPFGLHLWGFNASAQRGPHAVEAGEALSAALDAWAAERGIKRGVSFCRSKGALKAYARHGWSQGGYLIEKDFTGCQH